MVQLSAAQTDFMINFFKEINYITHETILIPIELVLKIKSNLQIAKIQT